MDVMVVCKQAHGRRIISICVAMFIAVQAGQWLQVLPGVSDHADFVVHLTQSHDREHAHDHDHDHDHHDFSEHLSPGHYPINHPDLTGESDHSHIHSDRVLVAEHMVPGFSDLGPPQRTPIAEKGVWMNAKLPQYHVELFRPPIL